MEHEDNIIRVPFNCWRRSTGTRRLSRGALDIISLEDHTWTVRRDQMLEFLNTIQHNLDAAEVDYSHLYVIEEARADLMQAEVGTSVELITAGVCEYLIRNELEHLVPHQIINAKHLNK